MTRPGPAVTRLPHLLMAVGLAILLAACARKVELMSAIPEAEANEILGALQNAGIPAEKVPGKEGMVGLHIAGDQVGHAVDLLREQGLPRERFAGMGQVFKKEGLISSPLEERARYLYALTQELGATLNQIDGVIVARVHVVLPERSATGEASSPSSAAVFLKYQEGYDMESVQPLVRRLVTNSIPGLAPEKLTIVMVPGQSQRMRGGQGSLLPPAGAPQGDAVPSSGQSAVAGATGVDPAASAPAGSAGSASARGAGSRLQIALILLGVLALASASALFALRKGWLTRWLPGGIRARLGMG